MYRVLVVKAEGKRALKDLDVRRRILLKLILEK
jgi:hypothetical protein